MRLGMTMIIVCIFLFIGGCFQAEESQEEVTISAAASLRDALTEIVQIYEKEQNGRIKLLINFGSSGSLQKQIEQGAPADIFFSASQERFDVLLEKGLIDQSHVQQLLKNQLVLIVPDGQTRILGFNSLLEAEKVAIGIPDTVPAGRYAKETLQFLSLWNDLSGRLVYAKDVRQVLSYVETGNVSAGIVYKTDTLITNNIRLVAEAPSHSHTTITYPVGVLKRSKDDQEVIDFYEFLASEQSIAVYKKYGFQVIE